ncbi:hypothetical protein PpBr36_08102 [Pyricularia pennisetigena]|uniref:hypothetical protein n=1 Tax=Pyricularia pennisetigena TaxID=1578925 RepID=UPI001151FC2C|nr:hypothetical protein PpBr36_08102 [Pyricularia pennisetigena]TLS23839.1 hypothetical protein PpBr36_08102 [Pyricularia pennisetigena]
MGPLIDKNPLCLYATESSKAWSRYIKDASVLFAYVMFMGETVVGKFGNKATGRIILAHPIVQVAEMVGYQLRPIVITSKWQARFGKELAAPARWRKVNPNSTAAIRAAKQI